MEVTPQPSDSYFWYALSGVLGTALFILFCWIANRLIKLLDKLADKSAEHDLRLGLVEKDVEALEENVFPVNYKPKRK